jgi:hypothetical protein
MSILGGLFNFGPADMTAVMGGERPLFRYKPGTGGYTFTRSSSATYVDADGVVQYTNRNIAANSEDFSGTPWTKTTTTITANATTAPDGTATADNAETLATISYTYLLSTRSSLAEWTFSIYAKQDTTNWFYIRDNAVSGGPWASFDLATGTVGTVGTGLTAAISAAGNGWYRCSISGTASTLGASDRIDFSPANADNTRNSDVGDSVFIWGAQLERGSTLTDYQATGANPGSDVLRDSHYALNPVTGLRERTTLLEEQRTNLLTYSQQFDNAAWTKTRVDLTANAIAAPAGTTTADEIRDDASGGSNSVYASYTPASLSAGTAYTFSCFAKYGGGTDSDSIRLGIAGFTDPANQQAAFNLTNGTLGTKGSALTSRIEAFGNGWYRCSITFTTVTDVDGSFIVQLGAGNVTVDGSNFAYIWGAQLEAGASPSSYIPTVASTATRAVDTLYYDYPTPFQEMTVYAKFQEELDTAGRIFQIGDGTRDSDPRLYAILNFGDGRIGAQYDNGTAVSTSNSSATHTSTDIVELRVVMNADGSIQAYVTVNGGTEVASSTGAVPSGGIVTRPSGQRLYLGTNGNDPKDGVAFRGFTIAKGIRTLTQMRGIAGV